MDPVTHILLGASVSYARCGQQLGRTAAIVGALAGLAPDADIFIRSATDPLLAIEHHRGFTHSILFAPACAAVVASLWLVRREWRNRTRWAALWRCGVLACISHCLLDAATSYGTQLLWPLTDQRFGWDWISIIDPLLTLPLLAGLVFALIRRRRWPALIAIGVAAAYMGLGGVQHARSVAALREIARTRGHLIERHKAMPTLGNHVIWRTLYVHDGRIWSDRVRVGWFSPATVREGWSLDRLSAGDLTPAEAARNARRSFERFAWFSDGWVARSPADPSVLADMRYSLSSDAFDPIWGIRFTGPSDTEEVAWVNRSMDRKIDPGELWAEITGRDRRFRAR